ncbi:DNA-3-methyladenine glycosylase [Mobilicoccus pelagius]|uniref:Putative 3-methyladenine DNA glycosylase n=1 Tax=Mobilicoccus pelagius NBRC 104925 TaxID=1089455 RepID=H5UPH5_9MICO|nr:DNA-3-methyladenine glycosylase [Mobilicoccus pelagius]GAB47633.1 putative 3-methyladenine DNA glycosylase [Mobilicoccus pelagius NBRC 104925]
MTEGRADPRRVSAGEVLGEEFFHRPVLEVAPDLLGCVLRHGDVAVRLTEVEAYAGPRDPGSHAYRGPTPRTEVMFGPPGRLYVYFSYGMHHCVNVVCGPDGEASAVLLRAGEVVEGIEEARRRRTRDGRPAPADRDLARGPARLTVTLGLDRRHDGLDTTVPGAEVVLLRGDGTGAPGEVLTGPRVGVSGPGGGPEYPWRFHLDDPSVSPYRAAAPRRRRTPGKLDPGTPRATAADRPKG